MTEPARPLHVLVLDDDEKILRLLKIFMRQLGYQVFTGLNGREGIRMMLKHSFDLIIVDVQMPEVDGFEFAEEVLRLWPWEKIIMCTGFLDEEVESRARSLGIRHILEKPISFNTLEESIRKVCAGTGTPEGTAAQEAAPEPGFGCELGHLRTFTHDVMGHLHFGTAISDFAKVLPRVIPCAGAGVFGVHGDYARFSVFSENPVDPEFLSSIQEKIRSHLEFFSGDALTARPRPETRVVRSRRDPISGSDHYALMTPVAGSRDAVGMLFVLLDGKQQGPPAELSALMICAHHLSTLLETLEPTEAGQIRDPLTGLFTWNYLKLQVAQAWTASEQEGKPVALLDLDLDHFRAFNDRHGFEAGDRVLREMATLLEDLLQDGELCGRRTADEFCILVPRADPGRVRELSQRITEAATRLSPPSEEADGGLSASVGYAVTVDNHGITSASQLLECAEHARFVAERTEGTRICSWTELKASGQASYTLHPVLVVDDDPQINVLIKRILNQNMYEVTGVGTVAEAMSLLEKGNRYEVLLTDLALPHQDGMEMIRLGAEVDPDMIPVVISGNISKDSEGKLLQRGAREIIRKPFDPAHLRQVVQDAVELYTRSQRKSQ